MYVEQDFGLMRLQCEREIEKETKWFISMPSNNFWLNQRCKFGWVPSFCFCVAAQNIIWDITGGKVAECTALKLTIFMDPYSHYVGNAYK